MVKGGQSKSSQIRSNLNFVANFGQRWLNMVNQLSEIGISALYAAPLVWVRGFNSRRSPQFVF